MKWPYQREEAEFLSKIIPFISEFHERNETEIKRVEFIPPDKVLFYPWHEGRLERLIEKKVRPENLEPIIAEKYIIGNRIFYTLTDGNHRTAYCYIRGALVPAKIYGIGEGQKFYIVLDDFNNPLGIVNYRDEFMRFINPKELDWIRKHFENGIDYNVIK